MKDVLATAMMFTGFAGFAASIAGVVLAGWSMLEPAASYVAKNAIALDAVARIAG